MTCLYFENKFYIRWYKNCFIIKNIFNMEEKDIKQNELNSEEIQMGEKEKIVPQNSTEASSNNLTKEEEQNKNKIEEQNPDLDNFNTLLKTILDEKEVSKLTKVFYKHLLKIIGKHEISKKYDIIFLYDSQNSISENMADKIYSVIPTKTEKPVLLILHSRGGQIEQAYLISKTCKENSKKFNVAIPRKAKSAATLIALGADEIHMGTLSELGPIDPQFGGLPALGLTSSLESLAKVVTKYPKSSEMLANFLAQKLDLRILGYFERVSESAMQYATRLLGGKIYPSKIEDIARNFVYEYKDHSFVIDKEEAINFLGDTIKTNTEEYLLANDIHQFMSTLNNLVGIIRKKNIAIIGGCKGLIINDIENN